MRISVILSTYNSPAWLCKVLWGYACQTYSDFEIVIADDGSTDETARLIERLRTELGLSLKHVWHEDRGFRKCEILNRGIVAASGDYLIFSDGDCIPRRDFVQVHASFATPGRFLSGGYIKLPRQLSHDIRQEDIETGRIFSVVWLHQHGLRMQLLKDIRIWAQPELARWLNHLTTTRPTWNGNNASGWRSDILDVGGFDQRMAYGGEDREHGERLENRGIRGVQIRYSAICLHLDHDRSYVDAEKIAYNNLLRRECRRKKLVRTDFGLAPDARHRKAA